MEFTQACDQAVLVGSSASTIQREREQPLAKDAELANPASGRGDGSVLSGERSKMASVVSRAMRTRGAAIRFAARASSQQTAGQRQVSASAAAAQEEEAGGVLGKAHVPLGEDGQGVYSEATLGCFRVIQNSEQMVLDSVRSIPAPREDNPFVIVDYGTADAGTSLPLMHSAIKALRERLPEKEVLVVYEDQPNNEWRSVFFHTQGIKDVPGVPLFTRDFDNVHVLASGVSFHQQCFPKNYVHLGMCFTAMHWLNTKPCDIVNALHHTQANEEEKCIFAEQARKDWENLLLHRAHEMTPGGRQVIVNFAVDENGYYLGATDGKENMHANFNAIWSAMCNEGKITAEEYHRTTFINYYRNPEETKAPFTPGNPVYDAGLRLLACETRVTRCPFHEHWMQHGGDPMEHAQWFVPTTRTWSNSTFLSALDESRSMEEREALVEEMYQRYASRVAEDPSRHGMDYVHCMPRLDFSVAGYASINQLYRPIDI